MPSRFRPSTRHREAELTALYIFEEIGSMQTRRLSKYALVRTRHELYNAFHRSLKILVPCSKHNAQARHHNSLSSAVLVH